MDQARFSRVELITIAVVTLVFAALCALGLRAYLNRDNRWVHIVSPTNEKAVEIVAVTRLLQPYVRTEQGNFYRCSGSTWRDTCEVVAAERLPANPIPGRWLTCQPEIPALPPLSGAVCPLPRRRPMSGGRGPMPGS